MSDSAASLRHKIAGAVDLQAVVRTMKAMAASSIGQYENAVRALEEYDHTVQRGLAVCLRAGGALAGAETPRVTGTIGALVFGSDQGLVGQFNEVLLAFVEETLGKIPGRKQVWAVGEQVQARLVDTGVATGGAFALPKAVGAITPLVGQLLQEIESRRQAGELTQVYVFHNRPRGGAVYEPICQRLLPLDEAWRQNLARAPWPVANLPEVLNDAPQTLRAFLREFLFVSLFRACAESLASENASRLAAMQRAEKNIEELLADLNRNFHRLRQGSIDEELFDVVAGFEALSGNHSGAQR